MDKRDLERVTANIMIRFYCIDTEYSGTIINLSRNGMCINIGDNFLPCGTKVKLFVPLIKKVVNIDAKISWIIKLSDLNFTIGVKLVKTPNDYIEFANSYSNTMKS